MGNDTPAKSEVTISWSRHFFAFLSFVLPMLIIGFGYKYGVYKNEYAALGLYRNDILMLFAFGSLFIQGMFWAYIYTKLFINEKFITGALKLFLLSFPVGLSFNVFVIGAKHVMNSVSQFAILESGFTLIAYAVICPLIAFSYSLGNKTYNSRKVI